ncbi:MULTISPECIES: aldo/keto reductase [Spirulina sp. CCY15215]|uniref:aldo/keto reductase n=1 Tax=Spirulina sp. CCY15215 TaxID=2767591 RepID=UPI001EF1978C|nr:aldo/keto reductase [Spirulina major]
MNIKSDCVADSFILGCWQLDDRSWKATPETDLARAIDTYLAWGVIRFDTADIYGRSERILGRCLKGRPDCQIFTKAVFFDSVPTAKQIQNKIESALRNLQRDRLDCIQIHWHDPRLDFTSTLEEFSKYVERGKIARLGVTNFNTPMLKKALQIAPIKSNQVQYSLIDRRLENSLQAFCLQAGIEIFAYGSLAAGFLSDKFVNVESPLSEKEHARSFYYSNMIAKHGGWEAVRELLLTLDKIAKKYRLSISQVALNWLNNRQIVSSIVTGLTNDRQQIKSNMEALKTAIDPEDLEMLSTQSEELFEQVGDIYSYERGF